MSKLFNNECKTMSSKSPQLNPALIQRLRAELQGELLLDDFSRGRYATDASIYQMMPLGVMVPYDVDDVRRAVRHATEFGCPLLPRGSGTSQCGQTVNNALVIDFTKRLNRMVELNVENQRCTVEPGIVLDELNRYLKPHGLWFPVDVSTSSRATIGGMTANNSCGSRSIRYGLMRDNVSAIDAIMANGEDARFGVLGADSGSADSLAPATLISNLLDLGERESEEIASRFPKVMRRVGGYNIDALTPRNGEVNLAHLLVGSEGTLALSHQIELKLSPLPRNKVLGVCHFPTFYAAMDAAQHLVELEPVAVELIDRTMIELARNIPLYRRIVDQFVRGEPDALLLVEFAQEDAGENMRRLKMLSEVMADLGFGWNNPPHTRGGVVEAVEADFQSAIFEVRKSGLNIMMSMKEERKPVSFVEDCAVELKDLAEYTAKLTDIFGKYGTTGTWYAHASVGCLHVRPVLNLRLDQDTRAMRAIAEEAFELVTRYKGSHSGEHGDGIVRSEFHHKMFGRRMVNAFQQVKNEFDPKGIFNPGKIVSAPDMDDRELFRYPPGYEVKDFETVFDWSAWPGNAGGFQGAVEMCNNNGACRKLSGGTMCPSYRVTRNEKDLTRGRANTLRLAISGQLGLDALASEEMLDTMKLCVSCKACRRECPTGVDMARMKIEALAVRRKSHALSLQDRLVGYLPRYAPFLSRFPALANLRNEIPGFAAMLEPVTGFSRKRRLPAWRRDVFRPPQSTGPTDGRPVVLFADTFNTYFEPENLRAAIRVLTAAGYRVLCPRSEIGEPRPLCCGRTFLTNGLVEQATHEISRLVECYLPMAREGIPIVGLEPSCLLSLRDELPGLLPGEESDTIAGAAVLLEEFLAREKPNMNLRPLKQKALLHGHCHQKAFDAMDAVEQTLQMIPALTLERIESGCCGMAGAFGYGADTADISMQMAEADLLPSIRKASSDSLIVADGTSCRHQIEDCTDRQALHVVRVLERALE